MAEEKVNGPEGSVLTEMIKQLLRAKMYGITTKYLQARFMGRKEAHSSWKIVKKVSLRKPDAEPKKGIRTHRATAVTLVMSKWSATKINWTTGKGKRT